MSDILDWLGVCEILEWFGVCEVLEWLGVCEVLEGFGVCESFWARIRKVSKGLQPRGQPSLRPKTGVEHTFQDDLVGGQVYLKGVLQSSFRSQRRLTLALLGLRVTYGPQHKS